MLQAVRDHAAQDEKIADAVRRRAWVLTVALTMTIALAGAAAAMLTARRIARPLNDLLLGIRRVMTGDWSHQVRTTAAGEIGELGAAFNAMVREARERRAELEEHTRTLEERVRRRTEELRQKEQALVQSEKLASLGLLAAGVAHELNNPLTSIVMNTHLALEEVGAEAPIRAELRKIDADAGRCRRIVEDLRAFASWSGRGGRTRGSRSRSRTTVPGSLRRSGRRSTTPSSRPSPTARGSACRSATGSSASTAAAWRWRA